MPESAIRAVFFVLLIGQILAAWKNRLAGVLYYCVVGPLDYFSLWQGATWDPQRSCAAVLLATELLRRRGRSFARFPFWFAALAWYGCLATLLFAILGPITVTLGPSPVYGILRPFIRVAEWLVTVGVAALLAGVVSKDWGLHNFSRVVIPAAVVLSLYGIYQVVADRLGLPSTGIRVPIWNATGIIGEQFSRMDLGGLVLLRASSFLGEPKGLGAVCVFWLSLVLARWLYPPTLLRWSTNRAALTPVVMVLLSTLVLTASTSAWAGALVVIFLFGGCVLRSGFSRLTAITAACVAAAGVVSAGLGSSGALSGLLRLRTVKRFSESGFLDDPEVSAIEILWAKPWIVVLGSGIGGIAPYLAERMNRSDAILFPNNGLLAFVCDTGMIGVSLLAIGCWRPLVVLTTTRRLVDPTRVARAFVGLTAVVQCCLFGTPYLRITALGFLLSAHDKGPRSYLRLSVPAIRHEGSNCKHGVGRGRQPLAVMPLR